MKRLIQGGVEVQFYPAMCVEMAAEHVREAFGPWMTKLFTSTTAHRPDQQDARQPRLVGQDGNAR